MSEAPTPQAPKHARRQASRSRFFTCAKHGWDALGSPCPDCRSGDAPRYCSKHEWSHLNKGCPECAGR